MATTTPTCCASTCPFAAMFSEEQRAAMKPVITGDFSADAIAKFKSVCSTFTPEQKAKVHEFIETKFTPEQQAALKAAWGPCCCSGGATTADKPCTCSGGATTGTSSCSCSGGASSSCCGMFTEEQKAACKGVVDGDFSAESIARCKAAAAAFTPEQKECFHKFLAMKLTPEQLTQLKAAMGCHCSGTECTCHGTTTGASSCCSGGDSSCCNMFNEEQKAACKGVVSGDFSAESIATFKAAVAAFTPEQKECLHKFLFMKLSADQLIQLKAAMGCHCTGECTCHGGAEKPSSCCSGGASSSCCGMFTEEQKAACKGVVDGDFSAESIARCKGAAAAFTPEQKECFHKFLAMKLTPEQMTQLKATMGCTGGSCSCCGH